MIDVALRERQFARVLGFLDEQLGDSDVAIVFGDSDGESVYFVSSRRIDGYEREGTAFVKSWKLRDLNPEVTRYLQVQHCGYYTSFEVPKPESDATGNPSGYVKRQPFPEEAFFGLTKPYAFNFSHRLMSAVDSEYARGSDFLEDWEMCHEAAHGIIGKNRDIMRQLPPNTASEEALSHLVSMDYASRFYPARRIWLLGYLNPIMMGPGAYRMFEEEHALRNLQQQIRQRNPAK